MAPRASKRKSMEGDEKEQAKPEVQETLKRVTRSMSKPPNGNPQASITKPKAKAKAKANPKKQKESKEEDGVGASPESTVAEDGTHNKTLVVEYCKQCNAFKTRAFQVRDGLVKAVPGIKVLLNPEKPRRGCFEIREDGGETFICLLDMKRPFKPMKELDMEKVISDTIEKIK